MPAPAFKSGAEGCPLFPSIIPPQNEGGWRAARRMPRITRGASRLLGRVRNAGPWRFLREERPRLKARHRGILPLSRLRRPDLPGASSTPWRLPGGRPGTWLRAAHAGAASRPALTTPREVAPLGGRDYSSHKVKFTRKSISSCALFLMSQPGAHTAARHPPRASCLITALRRGVRAEGLGTASIGGGHVTLDP